MRILYLITGLRLGGAEKQLLLLASQMQLKGYQVAVVALESGGVMVNEFLQNGLDVYELGLNSNLGLPASYVKFKRIVARFDPHIIHSHMIHANILAAFFKLFNSQYKIICTAHNIREGSKALMASYYFIKQIANRTTNVSYEAFEFYIKNKYFDNKRASFIPNAIDTDLFNAANYDSAVVRNQLNLPAEAFVFFSAGRLRYQKNYPALLNAFATVYTELPNSLLLIAGEGPDLGSLTALSNDLNIHDRVLFVGRRNDVPALIATSDCFVLSSNFEGFSLVVAEAMAMQKPVIATDCGGVKEVMGGLGLLINRGDVKAMAAAMIEIGKMPGRFYPEARKHIENNYSIPTVLNKWTNLYKAIC